VTRERLAQQLARGSPLSFYGRMMVRLISVVEKARPSLAEIVT
jgi:hypothetical protein